MISYKEHIEKIAGGYEVKSEHGNKNLGKTTSLSAAKKRLKQVEYFKHMKEEVSSAEKHHAMVFGRMNPVTTGHEAVVNTLHKVAKENNAGHSLVVSHSQDAKKNPLSAEDKVKHAKNAFPDTNVSASSKEKPTILHHAAELHKQGVTHLHVVAGSDREKDMHDLLHKYNGQDAAHGHYNFKKITVHSSGERDPDSEGTEGMSASKMREHAASGNKAEFHKGAPSKMKPEHKDAMYNDVRKGMNLKEQAPVAPVPDRKYIKGTPEWKAHKEKSKPINGHPTNKLAELIRKERDEKEKPVKEETVDQQADRAMQLKRFKDQMTKLNGPNVDTEIPLDKKEKDIMTGKVKPKNKTELGLSKQEQDNLADVNEHLTAAAKKRLKQVEYFKHMHEEHDDQYEMAQEFKKTAEQSKAAGNYGAYHAHMANHHDHVGQWHEKKGRSAAAEREYDKAAEHHEQSLKHPYMSEAVHRIGLTVTDPNHAMVSKRKETIQRTVRVTGDDKEKAINGAIAHYRRKGYKVHDHHYMGTVNEDLDESYSSVEHNGDHKKITHGDDFNIMIGKEHHAKISGLEHGERHVFKCKEGNEYGCWRSNDHLHFKRHSGDSGLHSNMSVIIPVAQWNNQDAMGQDKPVKEETLDQQDDRAKQLKRFKDQMTKGNGPKIDTEIALDKKEKSAMGVKEHLDAKAGAGAWINDFISSTNPRFNNKSKEERRKMAMGAFMNAKAKGVKEELELEEGTFKYHMDKAIAADTKGDAKKKEYHLGNAKTARYAMKTADYSKHKDLFDKYNKMCESVGIEEVQIDELSTDLLGKYKTAAHASAKASDDAGNYAKGDKRFSGINKATRKQFDNDLKKHGQYVKEGRGLAVKYWSIAQDRKETADVNKGNHGTYHTHMADYHDHMSRYHEELGQHSHAQAHADKADIHHEKSMQKPKAVKESAMNDVPNSDRTDRKGSAYNPFRKEKNASDISRINAAKEREKKSSGLYKKQSPSQRKQTVGELMKLVTHIGEGTMQDNGTDKIDTQTSAPTSSTSKNETPGKKVKGFKFFSGENQPNTQMTVKEETLDEKSEQAKRNKTMKNMMDASRGARFKVQNKLSGDAVRDWDNKHPTARAQNVAIGRALRNESMTGNPGNGYHGACGTADEKYAEMHKHVKNLTDGDDKTVKHYLDSGHGEKLAGREADHEHIKADFKKFMKYYRPEMHSVNVDKVNNADQKPHEEKFETVKKTKVKEENMKSYMEFLQSLEEASKKKPEWLEDAEKNAEKKEGKLKEAKEGSAEDKKQDKAGMKRTGMTAKEWEKSAEDKKEDMQEAEGSWRSETPWRKSTGTVTDKSGAKHTPMSRARDLARSARDKTHAAVKKEDMQEANWIKGAIKHPGAMTAAAKRAGETNSEYEQQHKHDSGKAGRRARLALTLKKMHEENLDEAQAEKMSEEFTDKSEVGDTFKTKTGVATKTDTGMKHTNTNYYDAGDDDETAADMKKKERAGRKTGQSTGSYKPRKTMSKLKQLGATYK